jgi:hypothetical protein
MRPAAEPVVGDPRLSIRPAAHLARRAVRNFRALPIDEQQALREQLTAVTSTLDAWAREQADSASVLCLGERHEDSTRTFIANEILPRIDYQVLMLETSQAQLQTILVEYGKGRPVTLLNASVGEVLRATMARTPAVKIIAIDENQLANSSIRTLPDREIALVARIREEWRQGQRHAVLFGALHCRAEPGWMLHQLPQNDSRIRRAGIMGAVVLARYREAGAQVLMYLLEEIGFGDEILVVSKVSKFPKLIAQWLPITADAFAGYDSAILFDDRTARRSIRRTSPQ